MALKTIPILTVCVSVCRLCRTTQKLGSGQFGAVYLIDSPLTIPAAEIVMTDGRTLTRPAAEHGSAAVKILHDTEATTARDIDDFRREMSVLRGLHHPNILTLLGFSEKARPLMLITEYADTSMERVLQRHVMLPLWRRLELAYDFAMGLEYLHSKSVIHRDLKPANLLIVGVQSHADFDGAVVPRSRDDNSLPLISTARTRDKAHEDVVNYLGHLEICDFGLAISTVSSSPSEKKAVTPTGNTGSYRFMAPEVHLNQAYDAKADIFSFGMILYWIVDGQPPFTNRTGEQAADLNAGDTRPTFKTQHNAREGAGTGRGAVIDTVSRAVKLVKRCWAAQPEDRPNASAICDSLEAAMKECPRPPAAIAATQRALQRWTALAMRTHSARGYKHQQSFGSTAADGTGEDGMLSDCMTGACVLS